MGLACDCSFDFDYDWYYEIPDQEYSACSSGKCYGCGKSIEIGDEVLHISSWEEYIDEYGDDTETDHKCIGRICETCSGHYEALTGLGYCLSASRGFIAEAMDDYREMLPDSHKIQTIIKRNKQC